MKWPSLVAPWACKTPVAVYPESEIGEDGAPIAREPIQALCSFSEQQRQILTADRQLVTLNGTLLFPGDLAPHCPKLAGTVEVYGNRWTIHKASRGRNPDGSVNYTKLEVM